MKKVSRFLLSLVVALVLMATITTAASAEIHNLLYFPHYYWTYGCGPTCGGMIAGYYDRRPQGFYDYPNDDQYADLYTGVVDGGVAPQTNDAWGKSFHGTSWYTGNCPFIASKIAWDNKTTKGHVEDLYKGYLSTAKDPYVTGGWERHMPYMECIADCMRTSDYQYIHCDAATPVLFNSNGTKKYDARGCAQGMRVYFATKGYATDPNYCFNQRTSPPTTGGFSWYDLKSEIDKGYPVFIYVENGTSGNYHIMVVYGYNDAASGSNYHRIYLRTTDAVRGPASMIWGGTWSGMQQRGVTVFHPWPVNFTNISVSPDRNVGLGTQLTIVFEAYENLPDNPIVTVNGSGSAEFVSKAGYYGGAYIPYYIYTYTVTANDLNMININGRCEISIKGVGQDNKARLGCKWCVTLPD